MEVNMNASIPVTTSSDTAFVSSLSKLEGTKAVFFDFGGTLAYRARSVFEVWRALAVEHGITLQEEAFDKAIAAADGVYGPKVYEFKGRMKEFWDLYHRHILNTLGVGDARGVILSAANSALPNTTKWYELFPESLQVVSTLKERGHVLGIITNSTEGIMERLKSLGLSQYLDTVVYSQEAGVEKPDPAPFELALRRAGRSAVECVFVGDSLEADVHGAKSVGIRPILVDRNGRHPNADCPTIRNLTELLN
jgi:putative hydrolase of the HAD superfamily